MTLDPFTEAMNDITLASAMDGERVPVVAVLRAMMALQESLSVDIVALTTSVTESTAAFYQHCSEKYHMTRPEFDAFMADRNQLLERMIGHERRYSDPQGADFTQLRTEHESHDDSKDSRSIRYTREQIVSMAILAVMIVAMNAGVTWIIINALEAQYNK